MEGFLQLGGEERGLGVDGCEMGEGVYIGPKSSGHLVQSGVHLVLLPSDLKATSYIQVLPNGQSKK
jgi:hypothetical protein